LNAEEDLIKLKKPSFSSIPTDKEEVKRIIAPLLEENLEVSGAVNDLLDYAFGSESVSLKPAVWNVLIDHVFGKETREQTNAINAFYMRYSHLLARKKRTAE